MARGSRYYQNQTGANTKVAKTMIYWDEARGRYVCKNPFSDGFRNKLQALCESAVYLGKDEAAWSIVEADLPMLLVVVEGIFGKGEYDLIKRPDKIIVKSEANGAGKSALTMFEIAGPDAAKKVYLMLINQFHPDRNPSPEAADKSTQINVAWNELKKHMGWN